MARGDRAPGAVFRSVSITGAIRVNIRGDGAVSNKAVFAAPAILPPSRRIAAQSPAGQWTAPAAFRGRGCRPTRVPGQGSERPAQSRCPGFPDRGRALAWLASKPLPGDRRSQGCSARTCPGPSPGQLAASQAGANTAGHRAGLPRPQVQTYIAHLPRHSMGFARFRRQAIDPVDQSSRGTGPQGGGDSPEGGLHGRGCRGGRVRAGRVRGQRPGHPLPGHPLPGSACLDARERPRAGVVPGPG